MTQARVPFAIPLSCPHCKTQGRAIMAEDDGKQASRPPTVVISSVSDGFRVSRVSDTALGTEFRCTYCDEVAG